MERCDQLARCTDQPGEITRTFCSPAMAEVHQLIGGWMQAIGIEPVVDNAGNLRGCLSPDGAGASKPRLLIGSHLDSVVNGGRYDGVLGVMIGLAVAELAVQSDRPMPIPLEVVGLSEEEGVRFQSPYFGSLALIGEFPFELLERTDAGGQTLRDVLEAFGCHVDRIDKSAIASGQVVAFLEPHIEQGPVLENENLAVASVTGIAGQTRARWTFEGRAAHAGTVPMDSRRDALAAAAETVLLLERLASQTNGMVGTVGQLSVSPNVGNVIPGEVTLRLEIRHLDDAIREQVFDQLRAGAEKSTTKRQVGLRVDWVETQKAVACDAPLTLLLDQAAEQTGLPVRNLTSGAGHDAAILARRFPVGLLFIRCAGGISHHPDEAVDVEDVATAIEVLWRTAWELATE